MYLDTRKTNKMDQRHQKDRGEEGAKIQEITVNLHALQSTVFALSWGRASTPLQLCLSFCLSVCLSVCLSFSLSVSLCFSVCVSVSVSLTHTHTHLLFFTFKVLISTTPLQKMLRLVYCPKTTNFLPLN